MLRKNSKKSVNRRSLDAAHAGLAEGVVGEGVIDRERTHKKIMWLGMLTGMVLAGGALVLLWQDALPGLALRKPNLDRTAMVQVPPAAMMQSDQAPTDNTGAENSEATTATTETQTGKLILTDVEQITKTAIAEKLIRAANSLNGNPGSSWSPDGAYLLYARASHRADYAAQQLGIAPQDLWVYTPESAQARQLTTSGALGWDGSWGSVRYSNDSRAILFYELFSKSEETTDGPRIVNSNQDGFYSVNLTRPTEREKLNVPNESRILNQLENKAFPAPTRDHILFVTQDGEYLWQTGDQQVSLGYAVEEKNGQKHFRYSLPTWSPDGSYLALTSRLAEPVVTATGTENVSVAVLKLEAGAQLTALQQVGTAFVPENHLVFEDIDLDWSADGTSFWIGEKHKLFHQNGKTFTPVSDTADLRPFAWSPDSQKVLALSQGDVHTQRFYIISLADGKRTELPAESKQVMWLNDNQLIVRTADGLHMYGLSDAKLQALSATTSLTDFSLAPDGERIAWIADRDLWIATLTYQK